MSQAKKSDLPYFSCFIISKLRNEKLEKNNHGIRVLFPNSNKIAAIAAVMTWGSLLFSLQNTHNLILNHYNVFMFSISPRVFFPITLKLIFGPSNYEIGNTTKL